MTEYPAISGSLARDDDSATALRWLTAMVAQWGTPALGETVWGKPCNLSLS